MWAAQLLQRLRCLPSRMGCIRGKSDVMEDLSFWSCISCCFFHGQHSIPKVSDEFHQIMRKRNRINAEYISDGNRHLPDFKFSGLIYDTRCQTGPPSELSQIPDTWPVLSLNPFICPMPGLSGLCSLVRNNTHFR